MSLQARVSLFVLASLTLVIVPAVLLDTYQTIVRATGEQQPIVAALGCVPLVIVLFGCSIALFASIFRTRSPEL